MSLRLRLTLIVVASVSLSVCLVLWLAWERLGQDMTEQRKRDLSAMLEAEEDLLEEGVKNYLSHRIRVTGERRSQMQTIGATVMGLHERDTKAFDRHLLSEIARRTPFDLALVSPIRLASRKEPTQLGKTLLPPKALASLVRHVPQEGDFLVADRESMPGLCGPDLLVYALPLADRSRTKDPRGHTRMLLVSLPLADLARVSASFKADLLLRVYSRYLENELAQTVILDRDGRVLACTSHTLPSLPEDFVAGLVRGSLGSAPLSVSTLIETDDRDYLVVGKYFRSVGWILCMQIDMDTITGPVTRALGELGWLTLAFLLAALVLSVLAMQRILRPLLQLTVKSRKLAHLDMTGKDALEELEKTATSHLPLQRHDELGQLARAYASMGHALAHNIRTLMHETAQRERMAGEIAAASCIQQDMLPKRDLVRSLTNGRAAAFLRPAREVGGDLYDVLALEDGRVAYVVGDVSGKGVAAALFMAMVVTHVRFCLREERDAARAMTRVNALLEQNNEANMFVTLFIGIHDAAQATLSYANGGHCAPLCVRKGREVERLAGQSGPVVGVMPGLVYRGFELKLEEGNRIYVFTDGIPEARDRDGSFFGEERLEKCLAEAAACAPEAALARIVGEVDSFAMDAGQADDITLLCLEQTTCLEKSAQGTQGKETRPLGEEA